MSLCIQGSTWHECAICEIPSPEVLWSSSGSGPRHCSHTNKMSSKHFGSTTQKEPIPSQEYHPLRWEWAIRFPYPHLPLSLSALGIEANKGPRLWVGPPPPSRGCQRCCVRTGCRPGRSSHSCRTARQPPLPRLQQAALCEAPLSSSGSPRSPCGSRTARTPQPELTKRWPETSPLPSAGSASSGPASVPAGLGDPR